MKTSMKNNLLPLDPLDVLLKPSPCMWPSPTSSLRTSCKSSGDVVPVIGRGAAIPAGVEMAIKAASGYMPSSLVDALRTAAAVHPDWVAMALQSPGSIRASAMATMLQKAAAHSPLAAGTARLREVAMTINTSLTVVHQVGCIVTIERELAGRVAGPFLLQAPFIYNRASKGHIMLLYIRLQDSISVNLLGGMSSCASWLFWKLERHSTYVNHCNLSATWGLNGIEPWPPPSNLRAGGLLQECYNASSPWGFLGLQPWPPPSSSRTSCLCRRGEML